MAIGKIQSNCAAESTVHTRVGDCDVNLSLVSALLATSLDFTAPIDDPATFLAAIKAGILAGRVVPINGIDGADVTGGDVQNYTTPYGTNIPTGLNPTTIAYNLIRGGSCLEKELTALNRKQRRFIWLDSAGMAWGEATADGLGRGFVGSIMVTHTLPTAQNAPYLKYFNVAYTAAHESEWANRFAIESPSEFDGLMSAVLEQTATAGQMRIVNPCSGEDVGIAFATEWAPSAFADSTGAAPTAATMDEDTGVLTLAPTTGSFRILGAAVLDGLDIIGLDGLNTFVSAAAKA